MQFDCPVPKQIYEQITLGHGGGGKLTNRLISQIFLPLLKNNYLMEMHDGAVIPFGNTKLAFTTDSFVVNPIFFPGGNIGNLAVHGTANDLAMCGARPLYFSLAFILEEGFSVDMLKQIVASVREASSAIETEIVTGDVKVVERGKGDGIYVNTTGIGEVKNGIRISPAHIMPGDRIILSGALAEHGIAILSTREGLSFETELKSDTASLWPAVELMLDACGNFAHALRDATRGGLASALTELAQSARAGMVIEESAIPVREEVRGACEILGLDPLYVANEGKFVAVVAPQICDHALKALQEHPLGVGACIIGEVVRDHPGIVRLKTPLGASRVVEMMSGEQLPRIC